MHAPFNSQAICAAINGPLDADKVSSDRYHCTQNDYDSQSQENILNDGVCTVHANAISHSKPRGGH